MSKMSIRSGAYAAQIEAAWQSVTANNIIGRIQAIDHTVWKDDPTEISNRLGWLDIADRMQQRLLIINALGDSLRAARYTDVLLLGMGGSSLAPEVFSKIFSNDDRASVNVQVLDSTDPGAVLANQQRLHPEDVLFIVATKSGGTAETLSFFKHFFNWASAHMGAEEAGKQFVAITDPGSKLVALADKHQFRHTYINDPNIGGRYSALSFFGLVPAAVVGVDVAKLLERAIAAGKAARGWKLGAALGALANAGRDKLTLVGSAEITPFFDWVEQLVAESTGKDNKGILPVVGEALGDPAHYGNDRVFVSLELAGDTSAHAQLDALSAAGHPVIQLTLDDLYDLGEQFFLWEMATAVAGERMQIQPFDQPNVESAKNAARAMIKAFSETGELPESESTPISADTVRDFLAQANAGDYVSIHAYIQPTDASDTALSALQQKISRSTQLATTIGYGPRFLHSTGQLHKGDGGNGLFIQITADAAVDVPIPDEAGSNDSAMSFQVLKLAQALGDGQALVDNNRRFLRLHGSADVAAELQTLVDSL